MARVNWPELLRQYGVEYAEGGRNVSRGYIAVHCPFCGPADESQHLSINLGHGGWKCWRNPQHRGRDPTRLLVSLLRISPAHARQLVGSDTVIVPDDLRAAVLAKLEPAEPPPGAAYEMPKEFRLMRQEPQARRFLAYLRSRRFPLSAHLLGRKYGLRYCTHGLWRDRIVFPVRYQGQLAAWTARSILAEPRLRYRTEGPIGDHLLWFDELQTDPASTILLCEGPFDALKVRVLGHDLGVTATCWFTAMPNARQVDLLYELLPRFQRRLLVLDADTTARALALAQTLRPLEVRRISLPDGVKDPGELDKSGLVELVKLRY